MDPEKPKFDWQRTLITTAIVLFAALVVGGTTWYVMDKSAKTIKTANDESVAALQKQIDELKASKTTSIKTTSTQIAPTTTPDPSIALTRFADYALSTTTHDTDTYFSYFTTEYANIIKQIYASGTVMADPVFGIQNLPPSHTEVILTNSNGIATGRINMGFSTPDNRIVTLKLVNGKWLVDNVVK